LRHRTASGRTAAHAVTADATRFGLGCNRSYQCWEPQPAASNARRFISHREAVGRDYRDGRQPAFAGCCLTCAGASAPSRLGQHRKARQRSSYRLSNRDGHRCAVRSRTIGDVPFGSRLAHRAGRPRSPRRAFGRGFLFSSALSIRIRLVRLIERTSRVSELYRDLTPRRWPPASATARRLRPLPLPVALMRMLCCALCSRFGIC